MPEDAATRYFAEALDGSLDISDQYEVLGDIPDLIGVSSSTEETIVANIRKLIEAQRPGIQTIVDIAGPSREHAQYLYHSNLIAAIDGTDAVSPLRFVGDTIYAVGMVLVTPQTHHNPRAYITRTQASHSARIQHGITNANDIQTWNEYLRGARETEHSWINTFREYRERELACYWLAKNDEHIALIDGPILTQNMLTQERARDLLDQLVSSRRAIGFIKNLTANPILDAIGYALGEGEVFVMQEWKNILVDRFSHGQENIGRWIDEHGSSIVRAIYKIRTKAFGVECNANNLPCALSILEHDNGGTLDHDIPMLLQIADNHVRARFNGERARAEVIARFSVDDPHRFLALASERELR